MNSRKAQIDDRASSPEHIKWIWGTKFVTWLGGPESFFWITGKPGSGKSTLMTHISSSSKTKQILLGRRGKWKIVHFFFDFRAGTSLPNSIEGLLRSLLYQVVKHVPEVLIFIDHDPFIDPLPSWSVGSCLDSLREAIEGCQYNICAFIDGLDEFEGPYVRLIEVLHSIKDQIPGMKLCLTSRPYLAFQQDFSDFNKLVVQEHNHESIDLYTSAQWSSHNIDHKAQLPQDICKRIREKANGVFLWARLAVDELLVDFVAGSMLSELYEQLEQMPEEVEAMYLRSLQRMSEAHQQEAAATLYVILQSKFRLEIDRLYAALFAMQVSGSIGPLILPIDCNANNGLRLFAVLGDLTKQTPQ